MFWFQINGEVPEMHKFLIFFICLFFSSQLAFAETVKLKNGKVLEGHIGAWDSGMTQFYFVMDDPQAEPQWISLSDVDTLQGYAVSVGTPRPSPNPSVNPANAPSDNR